MSSRWALLLLALLLCCLSVERSSSSSSSSAVVDKEFEDFVAQNNIQLRAPKVQRNCIELWGAHFDEAVTKGRWYALQLVCGVMSKERWKLTAGGRVVFFSASWSSESRRMNSIWEEFTQQARLHHPHLKFAHVSCDSERGLCSYRFRLSSFPHIIGIDQGFATVMTEPQSYDGLNEFVSTGWQRRKAERLPPFPDAVYLRFQRFSKGVEHLFGLPLPHLLMGLAACASVPVVYMSYLVIRVVRDTPRPTKNKAG